MVIIVTPAANHSFRGFTDSSLPIIIDIAIIIEICDAKFQ